MKACDLCGSELDDGYYRHANMSACDYCNGGMLEAAWERWGLSGNAEHSQKTVRSNDRTYTVMESVIEISLSSAVPFSARFDRQWNPARFLKWLGIGKTDDLQVGDPLFDDAVEITGDHPSLRRWLADEGVQTGVMNVVSGDHAGVLHVTGDAVKIRATSHQVENMGEFEALVTALAVSLCRLKE